ncbi:Metal binding domain of Ada family protein [Candida albicans]|uniref:Metal binding domain of Ada family protein n=1 Tax=Candida albicans TaxID=5476 RepID=A0A8H6BU67_CANAX|nr:Metal binding domain of Ada family protein [Candida albicans]
MVYSSEASKWKAYQFNDPFAAGSFFVCNKVSQIYCRPDCDARPTTNLKSEIKFTNTNEEALSLGYKPCETCDPIHSYAIDVNLLIKCVATVNERIGFIQPLLDENEESNSQKIKENIIGTRKDEDSLRSIHILAISKTANIVNDSDHYRLVDLACRHLALAAAINVFQPKQQSTNTDEPSSPTTNGNGKRRRRRGGVLGFKELAAKSKLSAWHFHRVFKSVLGLTPKTYGDKCWDFIKKVKESGEYTTFEVYSTPKSTTSSHSSDSIFSLHDDTTSNASIPLTPISQTIPSLSNPNTAASDMATISYPTTLDDQLLNMNFVDESSLQTKMLSYSDYNLLPNNNNSISNSDEQFQYGVLPSQQNYQLQQQQFSVPSSAAPALFDSMPSSSSTTNVSVTDSIPNNNASAPMFNTDMFKDLDYSQPTQSSSIDYGLGEDLNSYSSIFDENMFTTASANPYHSTANINGLSSMFTFGAGADEDTTANINNDDTITAGLFIPQLASIATPTGTHHN